MKANEKRDLVLVEYETSEKADLLYSKIEGFSFNLGEDTTIVDLRSKVQGAFAVNSEKITKDFYAGFKKEHSAFVKFISGIDDDIADKENKNKHWYTSIMLNRLMFCYFIQKKGFLNLDFDYLRHKLEWVRKEQGENRFFDSFYKGFLVQLFHDGLNAPVHDAEFEKIYGKIPYLNGGMFDTHILEDQYPDSRGTFPYEQHGERRHTGDRQSGVRSGIERAPDTAGLLPGKIPQRHRLIQLR